MKKLLLSSSVVLIFCSVSFGQAKKVLSTPKGTILVDQKTQMELEKKKLAEYEAQKLLTPQQLSNIEAEKMNAQKAEKLRKIGEKNASAAFIDPRSN